MSGIKDMMATFKSSMKNIHPSPKPKKDHKARKKTRRKMAKHSRKMNRLHNSVRPTTKKR